MIIVDVAVEELDREAGYWCNGCLLGSGWRLVFAVRIGGLLRIQRHYLCENCEDGSNVERTR